MSDVETVSFELGYKQLEEELGSGTPPATKPKQLHLESIRETPSVFQPRGDGEVASSEEHVRTLLNAIHNNSGNILDPIVVWWSGKNWRVIDGHHRLKAYRKFKQIKKKIRCPKIPITIFEGTLKEAVLESTKLNSKAKLPMTKEDLVNRAWRLVLLGEEISKRQIATICSIGTSTVGRMRTKLRIIQEAHPEDWLEVAGDLSWREAQCFDEIDKVHDDEWQERQAREWSQRLSKTFGNKLQRQPEIFVRALELYSESLAKQLEELFTPYDDDEEPDF